MEGIIFNKDEMENYGIEITSVNRLKDDLYGSNEELFFRGQKTDFWDVIPSIFRGNFFKCRTYINASSSIKSTL